jgi:hypothetical protein
VVKAGDGLSEALKLSPEPLHPNEKVYLLLETNVSQINHKRNTKTVDGEEESTWDRVHTLEAEGAARLSDKEAQPFLARQYAANKKRRDELAGQEALEV